MKKYDLTLTVTVEKDFTGIEAEDWDDAETIAYNKIKDTFQNFMITDSGAKNFKEH